MKDFFSKCDKDVVDLVTFSEENLNGKLYFCAVSIANCS